MRNPIKLMLICLFSLMGLLPVLAADLKTYQEVYLKKSEEILQSYNPEFSDLQQQYQKSLDTLKTLAQNQGDLTKTKAAIAEIDRFQKVKLLPDKTDESEIPEIKTFQTTYVKQYSKLKMEITAKLGVLTTKYEQALERLQKELTKAGKLNEATAVQQNREKAQTLLKGYADQLSALVGPPATNVTSVASSRTPATTAGKSDTNRDLYLVIDLSHGNDAKEYPVSTLADVPKGGWTDEYKTDKLVMRKIEPGTFVMGSPKNELGRKDDETQHRVTLTKAFYIGVFEVTQKQWEQVMGNRPSFFNNASYRTRPVEKVSYNDIRGLDAAADWPATNSVDATSFMGKLRERTGKAFDLPTESQWEYACRAGTATALNSGKNLTSESECPNMSKVGRYLRNGGNDSTADMGTSRGTAKVGTYLPNAWGLYDMHGNVWEWCLDWSGNYPGTESDPKGVITGSNRLLRGGGWNAFAYYCRVGVRINGGPGYASKSFGFRAVLPSGQ